MAILMVKSQFVVNHLRSLCRAEITSQSVWSVIFEGAIRYSSIEVSFLIILLLSV